MLKMPNWRMSLIKEAAKSNMMPCYQITHHRISVNCLTLTEKSIKRYKKYAGLKQDGTEHIYEQIKANLQLHATEQKKIGNTQGVYAAGV